MFRDFGIKEFKVFEFAVSGVELGLELEGLEFMAFRVRVFKESMNLEVEGLGF